MVRGVQKDASALGKGLAAILTKLVSQIVPDLYPKLPMGSRPRKGDEAEKILKAADLKALPTVFYVGDHGLLEFVRMKSVSEQRFALPMNLLSFKQPAGMYQQLSGLIKKLYGGSLIDKAGAVLRRFKH